MLLSNQESTVQVPNGMLLSKWEVWGTLKFVKYVDYKRKRKYQKNSKCNVEVWRTLKFVKYLDYKRKRKYLKNLNCNLVEWNREDD